TQMVPRSRWELTQIRQTDSREILQQIRQNVTPSRTATKALESRSISSGSMCKTWKAILCALLGPTPGSRDNSSMRSCNGPSNTLINVPSSQSSTPHHDARWAVKHL